MIAQCLVAGTLIINDLNLKLTGGKIYDLSTVIKEEDLRKSCAIGGDIYGGLKSKPPLLRIIRPTDNDYEFSLYQLEMQELEILAEERKTHYRQIKKEFFRSEPAKKKAIIETLNSFDMDLMEELWPETVGDVKRMLLEKMSSFQGERIKNNFVLI